MALPNSNPIPEKLNNFKVYRESAELLGLADVELPSLEYMTETITGAGIAGEIESPTVGHYKSMTLKLKWRTFSVPAAALAGPALQQLDLRGSAQLLDVASGKFIQQAIKVFVRTAPKKGSLGKFEAGKPMDSETELEVVYLKVWIGEDEVIEIDKLGMICRIQGEDLLADVRANLGMES